MVIFICCVIVPKQKINDIEAAYCELGMHSFTIHFYNPAKEIGIFPITINFSIAVFAVLGWKCSCTWFAMGSSSLTATQQKFTVN